VTFDLVDIDNPPEVLIELPGRVELHDGRPRFVPADPGRWLEILGRLVGEQAVVGLTRWKKRRSNQQNRFYWGVVLKVLLDGFRSKAADLGERCPFRDRAQVHEAMKFRFLGTEVLRLPGGAEIEAPATTTRLTTVQFNTYWRAIAEWAALECGIYIPEPNEQVAA